MKLPDSQNPGILYCVQDAGEHIQGPCRVQYPGLIRIIHSIYYYDPPHSDDPTEQEVNPLQSDNSHQG